MPVTFRLDALLRQANLSQRACAARSGLALSAVHKIATNQATQVSRETLDRLCAVLSDALGRRVAPGELVVRTGGRRVFGAKTPPKFPPAKRTTRKVQSDDEPAP